MSNISETGTMGQSAAIAKPVDPCPSLQAFLFLDMTTRIFIWSSSVAITCAVFFSFGWFPRMNQFSADFETIWRWGGRLASWVLLFNVFYVAELMVLRLPIPTPKPGLYPTLNAPSPLSAKGRQMIYAAFIAVLTKARYEAPFPAFLVFHIANLPPMRWLMSPIFGPKSRSCYVTDPVILDPSFVEIGRNVVIGSGANIAGHCQLPDLILFRKTIIEDDVTIGANSTVFGGVTIRRGAMVGAGSVVSPFTTIGAGEYWSGVPAVKIRDLPPPQYLASEPTA